MEGSLDRLDAMSVLLAAVEAGSLSKASRRLGLPLATVSRKVAELEAHLGADLLVRSSKGLEPTPAGRSYAAAAKAILEQVDEAERLAAGEYEAPKGDLSLTAPTMFGRLHVLPVVADFLAASHEVAVDLALTDRVAHFGDDQVDVAIRIGDLPDSSLIATSLGQVRRVVCASPRYLDAKGTPATPDDLARHSVVSREGVVSPAEWTFVQQGQTVSAAIRSRLGLDTLDAIIDAGLLGMGLIRANSYQVVEHVRSGRLVLVLEAFEPAPRQVRLVYRAQARLPLKLRAFIDFVVPRLRKRLADAEI
jgi:DNA-binding transcriptional LysR family regulator